MDDANDELSEGFDFFKVCSQTASNLLIKSLTEWVRTGSASSKVEKQGRVRTEGELQVFRQLVPLVPKTPKLEHVHVAPSASKPIPGSESPDSLFRMQSSVLEFLAYSRHVHACPHLQPRGVRAQPQTTENHTRLRGLSQGGPPCLSFARRSFHFLPLMLLGATVTAQKPYLRQDIFLHVERPEPHGQCLATV